MKDVMIGVDLAKSVFQVHGATMTGEVLFRRRLPRGQFLRFMGGHPGERVASPEVVDFPV